MLLYQNQERFAYDDSLDVVGVHGVGGLVGTIMVAIFASSTFGGKEAQDYSIFEQLGVQLQPLPLRLCIP